MNALNAPTIKDRASLALGSSEHETRLKELAAKHVGIVAITNPAGYDDAQSARKELKKTRVDLEHKGKAARDDANAFSAAVIAEEKRLVGIIKPEETRIESLQKVWNDKLEAERLERERIEAARVAELQRRVRDIHAMSETMIGLPSENVAARLKIVTELVIGDNYQEFDNDARNVRQVAIKRLKAMLAERQAHEAEQAKLAAERAELERLRAEQAERTRIAMDINRQLEEQAEARAKQEQELAARKAEQDRVEAESAARRKAEQAEIDAQRAVLAVEAKRLADQQESARKAEARADIDRKYSEPAPVDGQCGKCGLMVTSIAVASACKYGKDCACYVPGIEEFAPAPEPLQRLYPVAPSTSPEDVFNVIMLLIADFTKLELNDVLNAAVSIKARRQQAA